MTEPPLPTSMLDQQGWLPRQLSFLLGELTGPGPPGSGLQFAYALPLLFLGTEPTPTPTPVMPPWTDYYGAGRTRIVSDEQIVSLHTINGVQLYQFLANAQTALLWTRDLREVSRCELSLPPSLDYTRLPDIVPWMHWLSVWDDTGQELYWTGPIQRLSADRTSMTISARDPAALMARTRCPITKRWDAADPATVARRRNASSGPTRSVTGSTSRSTPTTRRSTPSSMSWSTRAYSGRWCRGFRSSARRR
jgi:hypothetical protein